MEFYKNAECPGHGGQGGERRKQNIGDLRVLSVRAMAERIEI